MTAIYDFRIMYAPTFLRARKLGTSEEIISGWTKKAFACLFFMSPDSLLPLGFHAPVSFSLSFYGKPFLVWSWSQFSVTCDVPVERFIVYYVLLESFNILV